MKNIPMIPMTRRILRFLLVVLFLLLPCLTFAGDPMPTTTDPAPGAMEFKAGEIIVKFKESIPQANVQSVLLAEDVSVLDELDKLGIMLLSVPKGQELEKIEALKRNPLVEYAEPNYVVQIADTSAAEPHYSIHMADVIPDDPWPNDLYFINGAQWNLAKIEAPAAWGITTGSGKVVIAFVDSGAALDHPELKDKLWTNQGETPGNKIDDDGNNFVDDVHGWDFVNWDGEPQDDYGHGTFVAGIAAAETYNGILMAGVSWGAEIMPVKVFDQGGGGSIADLNGGIIYAADNGAKIIDISCNIRSSVYPHAVQNVVNYARSKGALIVAGAGDYDPNDPGSIPPHEYRYPGALDHVTSVAATDRYDGHPDFSTYNDKVDIAAPGVGIFSFWDPNFSPWPGGIGYMSNTSVAAAHVSGLAALIWSVNPNLRHDDVEEIIESTAADLGEPGRDDYFGYGRIDAAAAVLATTHYLEVQPDNTLDFGRVCDHGVPPWRTITNPNTNCATWSATAIDDWLSISDPEGYTPSSAMVSIDKDNLPNYGPYTTTITAISTMTNYEHSPLIIPVTFVYTQCWTSYLPLLFKNYSSD